MIIGLFMALCWLGFERVKMPQAKYELVPRFSYKPPRHRK